MFHYMTAGHIFLLIHVTRCFYKKPACNKSYGITKPNGVSTFSFAFKYCAYLLYISILYYH